MKKLNQIAVAGLLLASQFAFADGEPSVSNPWKELAKSSKAAPIATPSQTAPVGRKNLAGAEPMMPFADTRLVLFHYDPDLTFGVKTKDGLYTHVEIASGDMIKGFYLSNADKKWVFHISGDKRRLFMKPKMSGLFTSATLVTEKRVYEMTFASVRGNEEWYQRVNWSYPSEEASGGGGLGEANGIYEEEAANQSGATSGVPLSQADNKPRVGPQFEEDLPIGMVDPSRMSFNYAVTGDAAFRPVTVFDDGRFTWLRFDKRMQDMPAIFMLNTEGAAEILNYTARGDYIMVSRLVNGLLLRLGKQEVRVKRIEKTCGVFGC